MSEQHCENYDVSSPLPATCCPNPNRELTLWSHATGEPCCTWSERAVESGLMLLRYSKFLSFIKMVGLIYLFCYVTNRLMTGPNENIEFCFPRMSVFPSTSSVRFEGNKIQCFPRDQSFSVKCFTSPLTSHHSFFRNFLFLCFRVW